jgi:hypothetical protein
MADAKRVQHARTHRRCDARCRIEENTNGFYSTLCHTYSILGQTGVVNSVVCKRLIDISERIFPRDSSPAYPILKKSELLIETPGVFERFSADNYSRNTKKISPAEFIEKYSRSPLAFPVEYRAEALAGQIPARVDERCIGVDKARSRIATEAVHLSMEFMREPHIICITHRNERARTGCEGAVPGTGYSAILFVENAYDAAIQTLIFGENLS